MPRRWKLGSVVSEQDLSHAFAREMDLMPSVPDLVCAVLGLTYKWWMITNSLATGFSLCMPPLDLPSFLSVTSLPLFLC